MSVGNAFLNTLSLKKKKKKKAGKAGSFGVDGEHVYPSACYIIIATIKTKNTAQNRLIYK